jgi:tRNA/rRNA methyltransferase
MITLACIGMRVEGNIGAIARVMKNFGVVDLLLIDSPVDHLSKTAMDRASHAQDVLRNIKKDNLDALKAFDYVIGTTAKLGGNYNFSRLPLTPKQLGEKVRPEQNICLVLGREDSGLRNNEIELCDVVVSIPSSKDYKTLNISHACGIILYELFQALQIENTTSYIEYASKKDIDTTKKLAGEVIDTIEFTTDDKKETQNVLWDKLIGKSFLTKRESFALMGFFKKLLKRR